MLKCNITNQYAHYSVEVMLNLHTVDEIILPPIRIINPMSNLPYGDKHCSF